MLLTCEKYMSNQSPAVAIEQTGFIGLWFEVETSCNKLYKALADFGLSVSPYAVQSTLQSYSFRFSVLFLFSRGCTATPYVKRDYIVYRGDWVCASFLTFSPHKTVRRRGLEYLKSSSALTLHCWHEAHVINCMYRKLLVIFKIVWLHQAYARGWSHGSDFVRFRWSGTIVSQMLASWWRHKVRAVSSTPAFYTAVKSSL